MIKAGFIGKVQLQIPVRQIRSAPWVIAIEQLYLVASPLPIEEVSKGSGKFYQIYDFISKSLI